MQSSARSLTLAIPPCRLNGRRQVLCHLALLSCMHNGFPETRCILESSCTRLQVLSHMCVLINMLFNGADTAILLSVTQTHTRSPMHAVHLTLSSKTIKPGRACLRRWSLPALMTALYQLLESLSQLLESVQQWKRLLC